MKVRDFLQHNSFIVKLKKNVLIETHKKNLAGQHSELFYWTSYGQFKSKMNLPLEKVSKIPRGALTSMKVSNDRLEDGRLIFGGGLIITVYCHYE